MIRKFTGIFALAFSLIIAPGTAGYAEPQWGTGYEHSRSAHDHKIAERVDAERAIEHVEYLSEEIGPRNSGLEGEKKSADYIAKTLKGYGYQVEYQYFPVADQYIGAVELDEDTKWEMGAAPNGQLGGEAVKAEIAYVEGGDKLSDYQHVKGKVVLVERGATASAYRTQVDYAVKSGAAGVILQSIVGSRGNYGSTFNPNLAGKYDIPIFGAAFIHGEWLKEEMEDGPVEVKLTSVHHTNLQSVNVIATKKAKDPNAKEVILGAHHDSVVGAPGANDNASGTGLMLELARVYKGYNTDKTLKFIAFGSEERGLIGSNYYVQQLTQAQKDRIEAVFVPDMVATNYEKAKNLYAMTVDGNRNVVTDSAVAAGKRLGNDDILPGRFGSSDHVPFHRAGIPSALFIWMGVDSWDPLIYHIEKVYHTPQDTVRDNISEERMESALQIIGTGMHDVARKKVPALN